MPEWSVHILFIVMRWAHLMGSTLLIGGTLFFEFVVPRAIDDLKMESQLGITARLRWVFRRIVWTCVIVLPITGAFSLIRQWPAYVSADGKWSPAFPWAIAHMAIGMVAVILSVALVIGRSVPEKSRQWMKFNLMILMAVMFIASASRHVRLYTREKMLREGLHPPTSPVPYINP